MHFGKHCGHINDYRVIVNMKLERIGSVLLPLLIFMSSGVLAAEAKDAELAPKIQEPLVGSWTFSGMVTNESGDKYGYFFQMQRQGSDFHAKTALIDSKTNKLLLFYEGDETINQTNSLNWHVGSSFIRYNPINDSWIFGLKLKDKKGFNFKVDMLKQTNTPNETQVLKPGVELQAIQSSRLNGHMQIDASEKEQFVTGNKTWFGKLWFSKDQTVSQEISTTFCRLGNENGFYSANIKRNDSAKTTVSKWLDASGSAVKMSPFISIKSLGNNESMLKVGWPKLNLKLYNTLKHEDNAPLSIAGFSKNPSEFCFVTEQSFAKG